MKNNILLIILYLALMASFSCNGFLDEKPQKSILVPATVDDVRAILDNYAVLNANSLAAFLMTDDWVTTSQHWESFSPWQQNAYLWQKEIFDPSERSSDYSRLHNQIFYANVCLDVLAGIEENSGADVNELRGEALSLRARALFELAHLFLPSPKADAVDEITIPVNLKADINANLELMGIADVIDLVIDDLNAAYSLLPEKSALKIRSDKLVAKALLSRVYLYVENWEEALAAAKYVVNNGESLLDYGKLDPTKPYPFSLFNSETVFYSMTSSLNVTASQATMINSDLYGDYGSNDLRKSLFFSLNKEGKPLFKGSYTGDFNLFTGLSLAEIYLTGAESAFRLGKVTEGLFYLNLLGKNRYRDFEEWNDLTAESAMDTVLAERRKELVFRGIRWFDMKRLRKSQWSYIAEREINGTGYSLSSEDQFTLGLPLMEIELGGN